MTRFALLTTALLLLALPATAAAKEVESAQVCGATQCRDVDDHDLAMGIISSGDPTPPPKDPVGWYRVKVVFSAENERHTFTLAAVPSTNHMRTYDEVAGRYVWMEMAGEATDAYREVTAGLSPRPASTLRGLDQKPPEVIVDEVVEPPAPAADEGFPWEWAAGGTAAALLAGTALMTWRRRRGSRLRRPGPQATG